MMTTTTTTRTKRFGFILISVFLFFIILNFKLLLNVVVDDKVNVIIDDSPSQRDGGRRIANNIKNKEASVVPTVSESMLSINNNSSGLKGGGGRSDGLLPESAAVIICRSQFHISSPSNEQSPILFRKDQGNKARQDLLICRCPKVGSSMLRRILNSYYYNINKSVMTMNHTTTTTAAADRFKLANDNRFRPIPPREDWLLGYSNMTRNEFQHWTTSNDVSRIVFVRHPIMRILSGYYEICYNVHDRYKKYLKERGAFNGEIKALYQRQQKHQKQLHDVNNGGIITQQQQQQQQREDYIKMFKLFMNHPHLFPKDYQSGCANGSSDSNIETNGSDKPKQQQQQQQQQYDASKVAQKPLVQHWGPPQNCRCGMNDCSINYTVYPIERIQSIQGILQQYLFSSSSEDAQIPIWFPSKSIVSNSKKSSVSTGRTFYDQFLQDVLSDGEILAKLNDITKAEQDYFGYLPLTIQHVQNGTVRFRSN